MKKTTKALFLNFLAIFCWAISPVAIRYVKDVFPVNTQNFFRYFVSLIIIWPVFFLSTPRQQIRHTFQILPSIFPRFIGMACINYVFQLSFTYSFFLLYPALGSLLYKTGVLFSVVLAATFFPDERSLLKNWKFQAGLMLTVIGVTLTIAGGENFGNIEFNMGVLLILLAAAMWSLLTTCIKKWVPMVPAPFSVSMVLTIVTPLYLLTVIIVNKGIRFPDASPGMWLLMLLSGIIGVGVAHSAYYYSVPSLGVALCAILDLSRPFLAGVISFLVFRESLTIVQILGGLVLLSGAYLVIKIRFRK
jgi:drug/metabolite transporter (DMT)-like permease